MCIQVHLKIKVAFNSCTERNNMYKLPNCFTTCECSIDFQAKNNIPIDINLQLCRPDWIDVIIKVEWSVRIR